MTPIEKRYIQEARSLAEHLMAWAKERRDEDKKAIAVCNANLCRIKRDEDNGQSEA